MGFFDRLSGRAAAYEDIDEYDYDAQDDAYADEYEESEVSRAGVSPIRSVEDADIARIVTVWVPSWKDIHDFAVEFRSGFPVILNLSQASDADRVRIVDFATGMCFALKGVFSRISDDVFLLTPQTIKYEKHDHRESDATQGYIR